MRIKAAVLEEFGAPLAIQDVELAEPKAGEVLVRLVACGVCHTDLYTASGADPSGYAPTVLGHEGAGVVEAVGRRRVVGRAGRPRRDAVLAAVPRVPPLPRRADEPLPRDPRAAEPGLSARRDDAARARRRADPALHGHLDLRRVHRDAGDRAREDHTGRAARPGLRFRVRPLHRARCCNKYCQGAGRLDLRRLRRRASSGSARSPAAGCRAPSGSSPSTSRPSGSSSRAGREPPTCSTGGPDTVQQILDLTGGFGADYTFEATGLVAVMRQAVESARMGWGLATVCGVAGKGETLDVVPRYLITGRRVAGSSFGGVKGRDQVPQLVDRWLGGRDRRRAAHLAPADARGGQSRLRADGGAGRDPLRDRLRFVE